MTQAEIFGSAKWLGFDGKTKTPCVRGVFTAQNVKSAVLHICGLGIFECFINGKRVSDDLMVPAVSDYAPSFFTFHDVPFDEELGHRCYALKYDVAEYLKDGQNDFAAALGPGYFSSHVVSHDTDQIFGEVRIIWRLEITDANGETSEYISDESAKWHQNYVRSCDFFLGENHDLRILPDSWTTDCFCDWQDVRILEPLDTVFMYQDTRADKVERTIKPRLIREFVNTRVYDLGENVSALVYIKDNGKPGDLSEVFFSEERTPAGGLVTFFGHKQYFRIVSDGTGRVTHPRYTWNAFRYFSVCGPAEPVIAAVVHADAPANSSFTSSSSALNWLYEAYVRTQLSNMHGGLPSDCPHIERRGYTGDGQLTCETAMLTLDAQDFYRKWMRDIVDCQDKITGHVQYTAPYSRCGGGPGGWGCAVCVVPWKYYLHYGDTAPLAEMYPNMLKYIDFLVSRAENGLVTRDREGAWCLGDWCCPGRMIIPVPFVNTYFMVKSLDIILETEKVLGKPVSQNLVALRKSTAEAIVRDYYDAGTGDFCENVQGANAFALDIGLGDARTLENMVARYEEIGGYDTGIFGTEIVTRVLFEKGRGELACRVMDSDNPVGFAEWMKSGLTTLPEYWAGDQNRSLSHPMFGAAVKELFKYILGIRQQPGTAGWSDVIIAPEATNVLGEASGHITAPAGEIRVSYRALGGHGQAQITIPAGITAVWQGPGEKKALEAGANIVEW